MNVIENEHQLKITNKCIDNFELALSKLVDNGNHIKYKANKDALEDLIAELKEQVRIYYEGKRNERIRRN